MTLFIIAICLWAIILLCLFFAANKEKGQAMPFAAPLFYLVLIFGGLVFIVWGAIKFL